MDMHIATPHSACRERATGLFRRVAFSLRNALRNIFTNCCAIILEKAVTL